MLGTLKSISKENNKFKLELLVNVVETIEQFIDKKVEITIKKYNEKRSLNANNYFWTLLQEICDSENLDPIEEYKRRVKQLGIFRQFTIESNNINTFIKMWEHQGIAWFVEIIDTTYINNIEHNIINAYYGSSSYSTKQMSRLVDDIVEDCKAIGIETKTDEEIKSLKESWSQNGL